MEYTELDKTTQLNAVRNRIRDLERQYLDLSLRIQTPDLTQPPSEMDQANLQMLDDSLTKLHQMEQQLQPASPSP